MMDKSVVEQKQAISKKEIESIAAVLL